MSDNVQRLAELQINRDPETAGRRHRPVVVSGLIGVIMLGAIGLWFMGPSPVVVTVETVRLTQSGGGPASVLDASGYVVARRQATVSSKIAGKVLQVLVEEGMRVDKDQIVAYLDSSSQEAQLRLAEAQLSSAQASLQEVRAQLTQAELDLTRATGLLGRKLISQSEVDAATANAETLRARLAAGRENVTVAQRGVDVSRDQLENTIIRAPFPGVVVTKNAQPGEMISPISAGGGFTRTGICTIVDMDSLEIEVDVNEAYIQRVQPKQRVTAALDAYPDWKIPAEVIAIVPTADRQKATVRVRIGFLERDQRILRDMGVKVAFLGSRGASGQQGAAAVYVSESAVRTDSEGNYVWIVRDSAVQRRSVSVGQATSRGMQIMSGLSAGDRIVAAADEELVAGQAVRYE
ncbi:MAG: efflux RND transporter periplasmic adaptor subunit [Woeseia sp.]